MTAAAATMVKQRHISVDGTGRDPDGIPGDCLRACVASLVDVPYEQVPHFAMWPAWWWDIMRMWARGRGHDFACIVPENGSVRQFLTDPGGWSGLLIGSGPSPRGPFQHVVLVDADLRLVHDPHPSNAGVARIDEVYAYTAAYSPGPAGLAMV